MSLKNYRIIVILLCLVFIPLILGFAAQSIVTGLIVFITMISIAPIVLFSEPKGKTGKWWM